MPSQVQLRNLGQKADRRVKRLQLPHVHHPFCQAKLSATLVTCRRSDLRVVEVKTLATSGIKQRNQKSTKCNKSMSKPVRANQPGNPSTRCDGSLHFRDTSPRLTSIKSEAPMAPLLPGLVLASEVWVLHGHTRTCTKCHRSTICASIGLGGPVFGF